MVTWLTGMSEPVLCLGERSSVTGALCVPSAPEATLGHLVGDVDDWAQCSETPADDVNSCHIPHHADSLITHEHMNSELYN